MSGLEDPNKFRRTVDIRYYNSTDPIDPETGLQSSRKIGEYSIDVEKTDIDLVFIFDEVTKDEIFGPINTEGYREYAEFPISYYPYDRNLVNLAFSRHRLPRLRNVQFSKI